MSLLIYGGSLEFVTVEMLLSPFAPVQVLIMALLIQARHLFYGLSMLDKFKGLGWKKYYLIFGMCDETFSINCSVDIPEDVDSGWFMFFVTLLNQLYWAGSATLGALAGLILLRQNIEQHNHNSKYHKDHTRHSIQCFWRCLIGNHCCYSRPHKCKYNA